jgi:hypothetical protein
MKNMPDWDRSVCHPWYFDQNTIAAMHSHLDLPALTVEIGSAVHRLN